MNRERLRRWLTVGFAPLEWVVLVVVWLALMLALFGLLPGRQPYLVELAIIWGTWLVTMAGVLLARRARRRP